MDETTDLADSTGERLSGWLQQLQDTGWEILRFLPLLLVAALVVAAFVWLAGPVSRSRLFCSWLGDNPFSRSIASQIVRTVTIVTGILLALQLLNATSLVGAVLGAAGVAGLALSFAFKDLIENYIAGVLLSLRHPFALNDHVLIEGHEGKIARLTTRATVLVSLDGNHIRLPNALVFKSIITNFTRRPTRRFEFDVGVGVDEDLPQAQELARKTLRNLGSVLNDPPPEAVIATLGDSSVVVTVRGWVDQNEFDFAAVRSAAIIAVKTALDLEGLDMPEPIYRVRLENMGALGETAAKTTPSADHKHRRSRAALAPNENELRADHHIDQMVAEERQTSDDMLTSNRGTE
ncbi:MAG TPA: mechanosensitive ion channel family protein [Steroidobacteraceae bacterium]|nr:mechanosensitive ion channel family protein [Steroidobacteraceae bacterium]HRX90754.1 mechanosensitive ion channel family protein [Steroidobacteraceae bacterium]